MGLILHADAAHVSPAVLTAYIALKEKELDFQMRDVSLPAGEHRTPEFRERSLTGKVPMLEHDGWCVSESMAIAEYLAERFPFPKNPRLWPESLRERARCRQLMLLIRTDFGALKEERPTTSIFDPTRRATAPLSAAAAAAAAELVRVATAVVDSSGNTLFQRWCIADTDLALMLQRLHANGDPLPAPLAAYAAAQWARPSVKAFLALPR